MALVADKLKEDKSWQSMEFVIAEQESCLNFVLVPVLHSLCESSTLPP